MKNYWVKLKNQLLLSNPSFHKGFRLNGVSFSSEAALISFTENSSISITNFLTDWFNNDDFVIVKTSGSTGKPKPIRLQKEFMVNSALATGNFFDLKEKTTALLCMSTDFIAGKMMLVRALVLGWELDVIAPTSKVILNKNYDFSAMVPLQLRNSLSQINKIEILIVGGGAVSNDLLDAIQTVTTKVFATYGMTETITHIAVKKLNKFTKPGLDLSTNYKVLPNVTISQDERNCLVINAPKVSSEKIITNDVVQLLSNTEFEWLGRFDNVINSGGIKLHPEKIEEKLSKIIQQRFFVAGIPDEVLGEKLVLVIEGLQNEMNIAEFNTLTKYENPKEIYFIGDFIETDTKKIQRSKTLDLIQPI